jgi:hypothetical protein
MQARKKFGTIDEYIKTFPPDVRKILERLRHTIRKAVPEAEEVIKLSDARIQTERQLGLLRCVQEAYRILSDSQWGCSLQERALRLRDITRHSTISARQADPVRSSYKDRSVSKERKLSQEEIDSP